MRREFSNYDGKWIRKVYEKLNCISGDHKTPFGNHQDFIFCGARKNAGDRRFTGSHDVPDFLYAVFANC